MTSSTKIAIAFGTLGRRILTERFRLDALQKNGEMDKLSYQAGLLSGLTIAKQIFETLEQEAQK